MRGIWMTVLAMLMPAPACAQPVEALFGSDGYRISHYRGPVPAPPGGVSRIGVEALARWRGRVVLVDVMPAEGGFRDEQGRWHLVTVRQTIPGARWFPEAGRGVPEPAVAAWFEQGVARLTRGDRHRTIVTFCLADCWMSWNAARRLRALGYTDVRWLAEGTDGWREAGLPLVPVRPERE